MREPNVLRCQKILHFYPALWAEQRLCQCGVSSWKSRCVADSKTVGRGRAKLVKEFETMRVQGTRTVEVSKLSTSLLRTTKKVSHNDAGEAIVSPGFKDVFKKVED